MDDESVQLEKKLKVSQDQASRLSAELDVVKGSIKPLKQEIKVLNKQLEDKGSLIFSLKETIKILESTVKEIPKIAEDVLIEELSKKKVEVKMMDLEGETKKDLSLLNDFLKACYKESQSVSVKTNLYRWRKLLAELTK